MLEEQKIDSSQNIEVGRAKLNQTANASGTKEGEPNQVTNAKHFRRWGKFFFGAGTRVLISHIVLVIFSTVISLVVIRQLLLVYNENETQKSLIQEVEEFRRLVKGRDPKTGKPFGNNVAAIFDVFLSRNVPNEDEFLLTFLNGKFYKSSPALLPAHLKPDAALIDHWAKLNQPEWSRKLTLDGNPIFYLAEPIRTGGRNIGVFVVLNTDVHEHREVAHTIGVVGVVEGIMAVIALTSSFAWLAAGRTLARLRLLTETARLISDSDLTQRISVQGKDEITELTVTFNEMLERLQAAFTSQRNFINDAGHELQTPITIVRGHLELLNEEIPPEQYEVVELVIDELDRMSRFVSELLLLAKAEQPDFLYLETVELSLLTEELYVKATALALRDWHLDAKAEGKIVVDRQRFAQAIFNLAQNATQHTKEGGVIALGSELTDDSIRFWVRDTGEGIALADQERIFQRFARGCDGRRRSEGAGLGLAIVRAIAEAHSGTVELISQPGCGSTFTVVIPFKNPFQGMVS